MKFKPGRDFPKNVKPLLKVARQNHNHDEMIHVLREAKDIIINKSLSYFLCHALSYVMYSNDSDHDIIKAAYGIKRYIDNQLSVSATICSWRGTSSFIRSIRNLFRSTLSYEEKKELRIAWIDYMIAHLSVDLLNHREDIVRESCARNCII